jgi:hypothetical protein
MEGKSIKSKSSKQVQRSTSRQLYALPQKTIFKSSAKRRVQRRNENRMKHFMCHTMNGKIFKMLLDIAWGKGIRGGSPEPGNIALGNEELEQHLLQFSSIPQSSIAQSTTDVELETPSQATNDEGDPIDQDP